MAKPSAQERDPDLVAYSAFSGVRNDVTPERFDPNDLYSGDNIDIDKSGGISRRGGFVKRSATATHSVWGDNGALGFCVQGSTLKQIAADYTLTTVLSGLTLLQRMAYAKVNDQVFLTNSQVAKIFEAGAIRSWGLTPPSLPSVAVGVGYMPAGAYQYVTTYVRNDGQESGAVAAARVTVPANGKLTFTLIPSADPGVVQQNVYLSTSNGDVLYLALEVAASITTATYNGDCTEFNYELKTQFFSPPPAGQVIGYYRSRMFVAVNDVIYPSEPFAYELFDLRNYIPMNGRVTMIAPMEDKELYERGHNSGLFLGTDRSCGVLVGNDPDTFQYVPKTDYGAVLGALDYMDGSLFGDGSAGARQLPAWLTQQGICVGTPGLEIKNLTRTRFTFTSEVQGAALFRPGPNQLIAVSNY